MGMNGELTGFGPYSKEVANISITPQTITMGSQMGIASRPRCSHATPPQARGN
ncbi:MAG: hypothetical protein P0119_13775 [Nitrospira sp.]|nr:hypothetical protein [Nitrospira sp.]